MVQESLMAYNLLVHNSDDPKDTYRLREWCGDYSTILPTLPFIKKYLTLLEYWKSFKNVDQIINLDAKFENTTS